jgi:hypothetical protein
MARRRRTYSDKLGTTRFVPNSVVRDLLDFGKEGRPLDLNAIWVRYCAGKYTMQEMREFYQLINYSVSGYEEIEFNLARRTY